MRYIAVAGCLWLASLPHGARAQDSGPTLDQILAEMQRPLPPLEEPPASVAAAAVAAVPANAQFPPGYFLLWSAALFFAGWRCGPALEKLRQKRKDEPVPAAAEERVQPVRDDPKALREFAGWQELLAAARAGNVLAREVLDYSPGHPTVCFELTPEEFKRNLSMVRHLRFSPEWVQHILRLLEHEGSLEGDLIITSPLGERVELPLDAPIAAVNRALGYETLPPQVREQLELRRWILWQTREDGAERPEVLCRMRRAALTLPS